MANAWGELTWGLGDFGLQGNSLIQLTGVVSSVSVNSFQYSGEIGGWGFLTWGANEWGDLLNPNVNVTGLQLNTSVGNEEAFTDIIVNTSTNLISLNLDSVFIDIAVITEVSTNLINSTVNSVFGGESIFVQVTTPGTNTNWGYESWGSNSWGQIIGLDLNLDNASIVLGIQQDVTGQELNLTTNTVTLTGDSNLFLSTNLLQVNLGDENIEVNVEVTLNTNLLNTTTGNESIIIDVIPNIIGNSINSTVNSAFVDIAVLVELSTNLLNITLGNEDADANTIVIVTTNLLNTTTENVSVFGNANIDLIGLNITASTGRLFVTAWAVVDIGVTNNWSVVDIAA
jgi:hypothetical protein